MLADARGLRLDQSGALSAISLASTARAPGRLNESAQRSLARVAVARIAETACYVRRNDVARARAVLRGLNLLDFAILR